MIFFLKKLTIFLYLGTGMNELKATFPFLFLIIAVSLSNGKQSSRVKLYCYDGPNCAGIRVKFEVTAVPDLAKYPYYFDNRIQSCLFNGMWILYDGVYYNRHNLDVSSFAYVIS